MEASAANTVELRDRSTTRSESRSQRSVSRSGNDQHPNDQSLAPCDSGRAAWTVLLAAFVFESLLWGFPLSFGIFQKYYSQLPEFADHPYISVIGTTASGISYMGAPLAIPIIKRFAKYQHQMILVGWSICILGLVAGSFASSLGVLIFTQGILYGFGFVIFYYPILSLVNEFWIARRGMAYGLLCSASGVSGAVMPFSLEAMLNKYGYPTTLRAIAIGLVVLTGPLIPLLKGRLPTSERSTVGRTDWSFVKTPLFWIYTMSNLTQGVGFFFPSLYLPSYASSVGLSSRQGASLLAIMSTSQVLGQFSFGYLSDQKLPLNLLIVLSTLVSAVAVFALWGLAKTFELLIVFALIYGFFGAGYVAMWARMGTAINSESTVAYTTFGLFCFGKGIGNVLAGPTSATLLKDVASSGEYGVGKYQRVVLFTGSCMFFSAASITLSYVKFKR